MNFGQWLRRLEESGAEPSQGVKRGPEALYGGPRTMLPVSLGFDNRLMASLVGGAGEARAKIRARKGAEPGSVAQFSPLDDLRRDHMHEVYMPLQLPIDHNRGDRPPRYNSKTYIDYLRGNYAADPLQDESIYNVDQSKGGPKTEIKNLNQDPDLMKTKLYAFNRAKEDKIDSEYATNFTMALMQASLVTRLGKYSHLVNLYRPEIRNRHMMPKEIKSGPLAGSDPSNPTFGKIMVCTFVFSPNKGADVGSDFYGDLNDPRYLGGSSSSSAPPPSSSSSSSP